MTKNDWIRKHLLDDDVHISDEGVDAILAGKGDHFEDWLKELVWDLHFEYVESSNVRIFGDEQGEVAASDA